jgi:hypothetical protein
MKFKLLYALIVPVAFAACNNNKEHIAEKFIETGYMDSAVKPGDNFLNL